MCQTVALLNLDLLLDVQVKNTFEYYFLHPKCLFRRFPIINTSGDTVKTLLLLDEYYKQGKRIFIGFNTSNEVKAVNSWFEKHPTAKAISLFSTAVLPEKATNIYRITSPDESIFLEKVISTEYFTSRRKIFYVYSAGQIAAIEFLRIFEDNPDLKDKLVPIAIADDGSNISEVQLQYNENNANPQLDTTVIYLFINNQRQQFIDLFTPSFRPIPTLDISLQNVPDGLNTIWDSLYFSYVLICVGTSPLWREGFKELGFFSYSLQALNALQLSNFFTNSKFSLSTLTNYAYFIEFNERNDVIYFSLSSFVWIENKWKEASFIIRDPIFGLISKVLIPL